MTIGILGAGQLGRMLALAGYPLGLRFRFFDPAQDACAGQVAPLVSASYDDVDALDRFGEGLDLVTYEFENVPVHVALRLMDHAPVYPPPRALEVAQDRLAEKSAFRDLGLPTAPFRAVDSEQDLRAAVEEIGLPAVLKTRFLGYDGKGQSVIRASDDIPAAWRALAGVPLLLERFVDFDRELSLVAVRGRDGATAFYPLVENHHAGGILRLTIAPAPSLQPELEARARDYGARLLRALDYVGVLAIEFFQKGDELFANEMAPRVHNTGHWTIEGAAVSQFENHLRAILGLPLGSTEPIGHAAMVNLIGEIPDSAAVLSVPGASLHLYGKRPRPGRKVGHVTFRADSADRVARGVAALRGLPGVGPLPAEYGA
ncbi:MAG TPA: 5-(carboxyamino)imidazole ribonucleotide synthase [Longimicrobiales bacterium]|nr:5-(carboxyamino)imidazole ribonucleotide synthase [Longimicrobiales bacterium]